MLLEFNMYKLDIKSDTYSRLKESYKKLSNNKFVNKFIVVDRAEEDGYIRAIQLQENEGIKIIGNLKLNEFTICIPANDLDAISSTGFGCDCIGLDIPNKHLTVEIIESIKKLND